MEKKRKNWILGIFTLTFYLPISSPAQITFQRTYGSTGDDRGVSVLETLDGNFIIAGQTSSFGAGSDDFYLIKADSLGDTLWTRTYGGSSADIGRDLQITSDGGFVITGYTRSFGAGENDLYLVKTDSLGDTLWTRAYGTVEDDRGHSVSQTSDGGYIIAGQTWIPRVFGDYDVFVVKTDSSGNVLWLNNYGGDGNDVGLSVIEASDGSYLIAGFTQSFGVWDAYLIKTDKFGETLWTKLYGGGASGNAYSIQETSDGGYILVGSDASFGFGDSDVYLIKTDSLGDTLWSKNFGGTSDDWGRSVQKTSDGGYIITGMTASFGAGSWDVYLIRTDSLGNDLWTRTFGGVADDRGFSVQETSDGGFVLVGFTGSFGAGWLDVYLIKTDGNGQIVGIEEEPSKIKSQTSKFELFQNHPNPFHLYTTIRYTIPAISIQQSADSKQLMAAKLSIYDITGSLVETLVDEVQPPGIYEVKWDGVDHSGQNFSSGIYFFRLQTGDIDSVRKMIILR